MIQENAKSGVFLSVFGFGRGNLKDATMEQSADKGNGNYGYIDSAAEAEKSLCEQMAGTLITIAKDLKVQIEFNPARVGAYRLLGYENRILAKKDFNDDTKDAGEIGAGHTVTALYEIVPVGVPVEAGGVAPLRYDQPTRGTRPVATDSDEALLLKLRYKEPEGERSRLITLPVRDTGRSYAQASVDFKFASSVAAFGMLLRGSAFSGTATYDNVIELATDGLGRDTAGHRHEFIEVVKRARDLAGS